MRSLKIACDIDGVVSDFAGPFLPVFNKHAQTTITAELWTEWSLVDSLNAARPETRKWWPEIFDAALKQYCDENLFVGQSDIVKGVSAVRLLNNREGHEVRYFTHRPEDCTPETFDGYPVTGCDGPEDKAIKAAHWGADVFIDDRPDNYLEAQKAGIKLVILWSTPYNAAWRERHTETGDVVIAAHNYDDVRALIGDAFGEDEPLPSLCNVEPAWTREYPENPLVARFDAIVAEWRELMVRKNHDYAGSNKDPLRNLKMCEACGLPGWQGVVVRLTDKMSRLQSFMRQGEMHVKDESAIDTFNDTGIYSILGRMLYEDRRNGSVGDSANE